MELIIKCIRQTRNLKLNKFLQLSHPVNNKINNKLLVTYPIATKSSKLLHQTQKVINSNYYYSNTIENTLVDSNKFEKTCEDTLESLCEYFEELIENSNHLKLADVIYSDGVLTVNFGEAHGTYVINRQSPNKQIWLSSPVSGPKRYDFVLDGEYWLYKHDGKTLHGLLQAEVSKIINSNIDFSKCLFSRL